MEAQDFGTRGEAQGGEGGPTRDPEWILNQEREEHRRLLAESHSASLDLRWKLQHGEKRWGRERAELLECFDRERQEWDSSMRELHRKMEKVRDQGKSPMTERRAGGSEQKRVQSDSKTSLFCSASIRIKFSNNL